MVKPLTMILFWILAKWFSRNRFGFHIIKITYSKTESV
jgi:hypothetical protein